MNENFNFHKELNIAKVAVVAICSLIIVILAIILFIPKDNSKKNTNSNTMTSENEILPFEDQNQLISLPLNNSYGLSQFDSTQDYILELRSDNDLNIFIEKELLIPDRILYNIVTKDKEVYLKEFESTSNISDIREVTFNNNTKGYTYCFHYQDSKTRKPYYLQIIWAQGNENYYVISIDFPLDKLTTFSGIINEVINKLNFK
jgi:hypothetical protein